MSRADDELAQQLDLARRARRLSSRDLAEALSCDPRTIRRYLSGDRRPNRQMVELWEQACEVQPGTLSAFHDRAISPGRPDGEPADAPPNSRLRAGEPPPSTRRPRHLSAPRAAVAVAVLALVAVGLFVLLRPSSQPDTIAITEVGPRRGDVSHHFTPAFTGRVWVRITPTPGNVGEDHRVRIRWGKHENAFAVKRLGARARTLFLDKTGTDDTTFLVRVDPPAGVAFGEGTTHGEAEEVPSGWTARTSG